MDDEEWEATRRSRVKELEAMVLQLERENKKLLNRVTDSAEKYREEASSASREKTKEGVKLTQAQSVDDLISLDGDMARLNEDEWLYVSPAKPPTPSQKEVTPSQWLSRGDMAEEGEAVLSLDDVRKDLSFQISNAETISPITGRKKTGAVVSPLSSRRQPSNQTAKRYLNQVRERRLSPSPPAAESLTPPQRRLAREPPDQPHTGTGSDDDVPIVKWRKPVLPPDDPPSPGTEEAIPVVRWKRPVMPQEEPQLPAAEEAIPVVKWKKPVMPREEPSQAPVPVVRWKKPTLPPDNPPPHKEEAIPIVKWKKPVMPRDEPQAPTATEEAVPIIKWKKPVMPTDSPHNNSGSEEVPVINWKPPRHKNIPIKAITTTARSPPEGEEDEEQGYRQVSTLPRSRRSAGLRPRGMGSPSSVQQHPRSTSSERPHPHPVGSTSFRSRSPSPSGPHHSMRVSSRSPSPSSSPQTRHLSPKSYRKPHPQGSSPTSGTHTLQPPKQKLIKSPSAPSPKKVTPSSSGGSPGGRGRGVPPSASAPRRLAFTSPQQPGNRARPIPSSPPTSQTPRGQLNTTTPESSPRGGPRTQNSPQSAPRRGLMQPGSPGSQIKPARHSAAPPPRQKHQLAKPRPSKQVQPAEEDWLEGCF